MSNQPEQRLDPNGSVWTKVHEEFDGTSAKNTEGFVTWFYTKDWLSLPLVEQAEPKPSDTPRTEGPAAPISNPPNSKPDAERWLNGEISLGRFIYNSSLESCYAQAADFAGGIANVFEERIAEMDKERTALSYAIGELRRKCGLPSSNNYYEIWEIIDKRAKELAAAKEEVEAVKMERNRIGMVERSKYLPKLESLTKERDQLRIDLASANDTIQKQHKLMVNAEQRGMEKARQEVVELPVNLINECERLRAQLTTTQNHFREVQEELITAKSMQISQAFEWEKLRAELANAKEEVEGMRTDIRNLMNEIDCRIEHGAGSGCRGHLGFIKGQLYLMLSYKPKGTK